MEGTALTKRRAKRIAVMMWQALADEDWEARDVHNVSTAKADVLDSLYYLNKVTESEYGEIYGSSECPLCTYFKKHNHNKRPLCVGCPLGSCKLDSLFAGVSLDNKESMLAVLDKIKTWEVK